MRRRTSAGDLIPAEAYGEKGRLCGWDWTHTVRTREILPDHAEHVRRRDAHSEKRPEKDATPREYRIQCRIQGGERTMLGSSCVCYGKWEAGALFGPSPTTEDGPRRTRRLRHCLSTEHGTPVFQQGTHPLGTREILPPDILRQRRSQAVVRRRRGGSIFYPELLPLELSALVNGAAELSGCSPRW